jgi:hypothetical protein
MWGQCGVQRDCLKYRGFHEDSMKQCFMDSMETLRGLLIDCKETASLIYLIEKNLIIFIKTSVHSRSQNQNLSACA